MNEILNLGDVINESFTQYAGAVIQSRALVDARDCVKPSARQIYYSLFTDKFTHDKPFKKTLKAIGSSMRFYVHGDSSCEGILMRSGQPFSMRYPLIEVEGSYGTLTESSNWAAPRYTASRLSALSNYLIQETSSYTIDEWADNYDDTEQYPRILSSLGYYNIVNGSTGIAVGLAASIPQFNLGEVNNALIKLLENPDIDFEEILCYPDFATGGTLINANEIKESLKTGKGKGCVLQATITHDTKENCLIVSDLPYGVYTNTICTEIAKLSEDENFGVVNINDLTGEKVCIKIYLDKKVDVKKMIYTLYANTSLQKTYGINMTMLEEGRYPRVYGWREALLAHLKHEEQVYINLFTYQLNQLQKRLSIVQGLLAAIDKIDEVIKTIKSAENTAAANQSLRNLLLINEEQAKAILDMRLSRLAKMEKDKYLKEEQELIAKIENLKAILNSKELLKQEMIKRFKEVIDKFADARRTKIDNREPAKNITNEKVKAELVPEDVFVCFTKTGYLKRIPIKMYKPSTSNFNAFKCQTCDMILLFSSLGKVYRLKVSEIKECGNVDKGIAIGSVLKLEPQEKILNVFSMNIDEKHPYIVGFTKSGLVKKSDKSIFIGSTQNKNGLKAATLQDKDNFVSWYESNGDYIVLITKDGYCLQFKLDEVNSVGKTAKGVIAIKLGQDDYVTQTQLSSRVNSKYPVQKRAGKGKKI